MGRGRKPPIIPDTPALPPPPPSAPDFKGAAPTMHYGEAPVPPKKKARSVALRSTAARAAEAARAAVWAVSSPKTTAQIEAAEKAFEGALEEHMAHVVRGGTADDAPVGITLEQQFQARTKNVAKVKAAQEKADKKNAERKKKGKAALPPPPPEPAPAPAPDRRPVGKDRWGFFREELERKDHPSDPHAAWRHETGRPRHELFLPTTEEALAAVEATLKLKLPPSYREFNLEWSGGRLYTQEWRDIRLVGAMDLPKELKDRLCERMHAPWIPLADLGDGDYLAFDTSKPNAKGEFPVHWWYGGHAKKRVAASFVDWLEQLVASGGEAFWWDEA
jgi:cell wall assembly regulator SMI1